MAKALGLTGPLVSSASGLPSSRNAFFKKLGETATALTLASWDVPRTATALNWFRDYLVATDRKPPFHSALGSDQAWGAPYNRLTLENFGVFVRESAPKAPTKKGWVSSDCISGYVSAIYVLRCREAGYDVAPEAAARTSADVHKQWLKQDGVGERRVGRGFRACHFERLHKRVPVNTCVDVVERAAGLASHNLMLRGGEAGVPDRVHGIPDPDTIITWNSLDWKSPEASSAGRPWLIVRVAPIKNPTGRATAHPIPVSRAHDGRFGGSATCAYDAIAAAWWSRRGPVGVPLPLDGGGRPVDGWWRVAPRANGPPPTYPFFAHPSGLPFQTSDMLRIVRKWATAIDENPDDFEARAFRIAGATDFRAALAGNDAESMRTIKDRGRWSSEIHAIYQRPLLSVQLHASAVVGATREVGLEDVIAGFAQPARR